MNGNTLLAPLNQARHAFVVGGRVVADVESLKCGLEQINQDDRDGDPDHHDPDMMQRPHDRPTLHACEHDV